MQISELEQEIVKKLKLSIPELSVEAYPDNPSNYKLLHSKGAVLVHYSGSKFKAPLFDEIIVQQRRVTYDIIVINRSLRGNGGIYETLDKLRETLTGFQNQDMDKMYPVDEEFILEENGIWQYGMRFEASVKHIENSYRY